MMTAPLDRLTPLQRIRRVRRFVREMEGQRALLCGRAEARDAAGARARLLEVSGDLFAELLFLESAGVLHAVEECFIAIFGGGPPFEPSPEPTL